MVAVKKSLPLKAVNDVAGCQFITSTTFNANPAPNFQNSSCTADPGPFALGNQWLTTTGGIGFRRDVALTSTDNFSEGATVYLFGGNRSGATNTALNGLQNDVWKGTISVVCNPPNATGNNSPPCTGVAPTASTQISWSLVSTAGTKPSPRSGAVIAFGDFRKLVVYGGTDATGVQQDAWELDLSPAGPPFPWRKMSLEPTPALAPAARTKATMVGQTTGSSAFYAFGPATILFGGTAGTTLLNDVWVLSRQGPARLLIKAPAGITSRSAATNGKLSIFAAGTTFSLVYAWDGSAWQLVGQQGNGGNISGSLQNGLSYVQPDGNVYLLVMSQIRSTPTFNSTFGAQLDGLVATLDFQ